MWVICTVSRWHNGPVEEVSDYHMEPGLDLVLWEKNPPVHNTYLLSVSKLATDVEAWYFVVGFGNEVWTTYRSSHIIGGTLPRHLESY